MFSPAIVIGFLGLSQLPSSVAQPVNASGFIIKHIASDYFPNAKGDLSAFDVHAKFVGYDGTTQSWLTTLNPASENSDEAKARMMTAAAYAKPFDDNDQDMTKDVNSLLAAIAGNSSALLQKRSTFQVSDDHTINWATCTNSLSCNSGATCEFTIDIANDPRSLCQPQSGENCCISWSTYTVNADFFQTTWNTCNNLVTTGQQTDASCEGYGSDQGGDVCLSDRATGCT